MNREAIADRLKAIIGVYSSAEDMSDLIRGDSVTIDSIRFMKLLVDIENEFKIVLDYTVAFGSGERTLEGLIDYLAEFGV